MNDNRLKKEVMLGMTDGTRPTRRAVVVEKAGSFRRGHSQHMHGPVSGI